jgi:inositol oxygenase
MTTCASAKKRPLSDVNSSCDLVPNSKKVKVNGCENETIEQHTKDNGICDDAKIVEEVEVNKSWVIDENKSEEEFRNFANGKRQQKVEAFYTEQHSKMTLDFVLKKREEHLKFDKCVMTVWDMLQYLDQVVDDSDPDTNLTQIEHAIQTAESARHLYPDPKYDWFHVTAFIHDLGKVLAVTDSTKNLKGEPQWCVVGDNFVVGCQFSETNIFYDYFKDNPDYKNEKLNTLYGIYKPKCGLNNIYMSWGHDEYMYHIAKNQSTLPEEALYMLRFHSFYPWHEKHGYMHLCNDQDLEYLKWVKAFNKCDLYSKSQKCPKLSEVGDYYKSIIEKYFPNPVRW